MCKCQNALPITTEGAKVINDCQANNHKITTSRLWKLRIKLTGGFSQLYDSNNIFVCETNKINARIIIKSVNCHDELVEALKTLMQETYLVHEGDRLDWDSEHPLAVMVQQVLYKAERI